MSIAISRRRVLALGSSTAVAGSNLLLSGRASAQAPQTLKIGHVLAPSHPFHQGLELAGRKLAESTNGRVKLQVFPSSQLGTERDMNIAIRSGGVDMLLGSPGGASVQLKELAILAAPYLFRTNPHWQGVVYGPIGEDWNRKMVAASKVHIVGWFHLGTRHVVSRTKPYDTLGAIANQKIRVADLAPYPQVFRALGAIPTPIAFAEMYQALQSGIVDGADAPLDVIASQKLYEVTKFVNLCSWSFASPGPILMSDSAFTQIGADGQKALLAAVREGSNFVTDAITNGDESTKKQLVAQGMTLVTPTDLPAWRAAAAKAIPDLAPTWGGDVALYARIRDAG
ncbi:MAG: TRAP transporter substrate-binding protein [Betaproteobacteria bacterium]|nr:TRAP transporter substrate-binding protein [Betaproteobacteria bacterium]